MDMTIQIEPADGKIQIGEKLVTISEPKDFLAVLEEMVNTGSVMPHGMESVAFCMAMVDEGYLTSDHSFNGLSFSPVHIDHLRDTLISHLKALIFIKQMRGIVTDPENGLGIKINDTG